MKKTLLFAAVLCGLTSFAVEPVAVWNGDFDTTEKTGTDTKTYTLSANGNSVATDGSTITISSEKGVSVSWPTGRGAQTTIVKVSGLKNDTTNVQTLFTVGDGSSARVGVTLNNDGATKGIWGGNLWYDARYCQQQGTLEIPSTGSMYMAVANAYNGGTHLYEKTADSWSRIYQANGLQSSSDSTLFKTVSIGGSVAANSSYVVADGMVIEAIAVFDQQLTQDQIAAYEFPQKLSGVISLNICNGLTADAGAVLVETETMVGTIPANAWQNICNTTENNLRQGTKTGIVAWTGSQSTTLADASVTWSCNGNDMANLYKDVTTSIPYLKSYYSRANQSGLNGPVTFTITGIPYSSYDVIVYLSGNSAEKNPNQSIRVNDSLYYGGAVDAEHKYGTYADSSTSWGTVANQNAVEYGKNVIRVEGQTSSTAVIKLDSPIEKWGIAAIQIVEMSAETEEQEETETINYTATGFVTKTYQQTGWNTTIDEILQYGTLTPTMSGGYMKDRPVQGSAQFITKTKEGTDAILSMQMQVVNDGHLKVVEVYLKDSDNGILIKATRAGHTTGAALGTNQSTWDDTVAESADAASYGVASVALSITKPADKKPQGSIDNVTTKCAEDYSSNTITAAVSIENEGDYKGAAVLVYMLGEAQYVVKIEKGSASITISDLEGGKVYRGTLALGQKLEDESVIVIEGTEMSVALYQGEQKFVRDDKAIVLKTAETINAGEGCTIKPVCNDPDYVDLCDSEYIVSLSASEAVDANADNDEELKGAQGGLRLVKNGESEDVKLEYVYDDNGTLKWGDQWPKGTGLEAVTLALDQAITVRVEFHYSKGEEDDTSYVKYSIGENYEKSVTSWATAKKVTEVFIADGTCLPDDLTGRFELDKAVVVDVEVEIGHGETAEITAADEKAAQEIADKMVISIASEIAAKLTNEQQEAYIGYFKIQVTQAGEGKFSAAVVFKADVQDEIEEELEEAMENVVAGFESGSAEIAAKPGLYYGVKRGDSLGDMNTVETELATSDKVTIKITKPEGAAAHFYRIIVSPTPAETK